jgi:hypothetical protein
VAIDTPAWRATDEIDANLPCAAAVLGSGTVVAWVLRGMADKSGKSFPTIPEAPKQSASPAHSSSQYQLSVKTAGQLAIGDWKCNGKAIS